MAIGPHLEWLLRMHGAATYHVAWWLCSRSVAEERADCMAATDYYDTLGRIERGEHVGLAARR
jgi:hypothetical protein